MSDAEGGEGRDGVQQGCVMIAGAGKFARRRVAQHHDPVAPPPPECSLLPHNRYASDETPMSHYLNIHDTLDAKRQEALRSKGEGPRTFVVGPTGVSGLGPAAAEWG